MVLADLSQCVMQGATQASGVIGVEVHDDAGAGTTEFFNGEHETRLGVVVVVADGHGPRDRRGIVSALREVGLGERLIVDGTAHVRDPRR